MKIKVFKLAKVRKEIETEKHFIGLIDADIKSGKVKEIPVSVLIT